MGGDPKDAPDTPGVDRKRPAEDEVMDVGQEEVFSRTEVELGRIEHSTGTQRALPQASSSTSQ